MAAKKRASPRKKPQSNNTNRPIDRLTPEARQAVQTNVQRFLNYARWRRLDTELSHLARVDTE